MDFEFSDDQEMLRDSVRRFLADRAPLAWVRERYDDPRGTTDEVWAGLAELGLMGILVPEEHGGLGLGMVDMGVVLEEMGRTVHPGPFLASAVGAVSLVALAGDETDRADVLPGLATGETVGTVALWEPGRRYAWSEASTKAAHGGGGWSVSGTKSDVSDGAAATLLLVVAATDDGLGVFAVDPSDDRVRVTPSPTTDGTRKQATAELDRAPGRRLGASGRAALTAVEEALDRLVVGLVVDGVGAAGAALDMAVAYAKERHQFGQPIGTFQAVQHLCADMLSDVELARAGTYYALWACDAAPPEERHHAATMAKAWASDALARVGAASIQVHGGIGFTWEHDAHLFSKRLLSLQHAMGGTQHHLEELARLVLD